MPLTIKTRNLIPVPPDGEVAGAIEQLVVLGYERLPPETTAEQIRDRVLAILDAILTAELRDDPEGRVYTGNKFQITDKLTLTYTKQVGVTTGLTDEDGNPLPDQPLMQTFPPRYGTITTGIPFTPNVVDADDLFSNRKR